MLTKTKLFIWSLSSTSGLCMSQVGEAPGSEMVEPQAAFEENVSQKAT